MASSALPPPFLEVLVDQKIDKPLCYENCGLLLFVGSRVLVPLRNKIVKATVVKALEKPSFAKTAKIHSLLEEESLTEDLMQLATWMSEYYMTPFQKVLTTLLPASLKKKTQKEEQFFVEKKASLATLIELAASISQKNHPQKKVLEVILKQDKGIYLSKLLELAETSKSPVDTLVKKGFLALKKIEVDRSFFQHEDFLLAPSKTLNSEQMAALKKITTKLDEKTFHTELLFGVTGSGKTEVYLQAIHKARSMGLGVVFLVPEIALTTQTIERLLSRFSEQIAVLHHRLSDGERFDAYRGILSGKISIVIGARSAIFAPVQNLGLIIVDEEQDGSFKQTEEMPCYNARDVAIVRAKNLNALCILGSATPCFETYYNAENLKYGQSTLTLRAKQNPLPDVKIVDMRHEDDKKKCRALFSDLLLEKIEDRLKKGEQTLLFLNRRGFFKCQICTSCNETLKCDQCDVCLTYHKGENILACHLCGFTQDPQKAFCKKCCSRETMRFQGPGTEQVERALKALFKEARVLRMDRDTTRHKGSHDALYREFKSQKADILIGTQMIAKGLDFPLVTLVGILNADSMLHIPDFRSQENAFQLLSQVSGRAGRGDFPGEVILQTRLPEYPVIHHASKEDYKTFFHEEIILRKQFHYPPFKKLCRIVLQSSESTLLDQFGAYLTHLFEKTRETDVDILPYTLCGLTKAKGQHRGQILLKALKFSSLKKMVLKIPKHEKIKCLVDVDPLQTFF
ncbi:primosomal protein N' [bacterium]|nr:primosomal protein N' [bacterium]